MTQGHGDPQARIGVLFCECGDRIAGPLDVPALARQAGELHGVAWAGHTRYPCMPGGLEHLRRVVAEGHLDRVVIAGCAPRTHEAHFRQALSGSLDPPLVNVLNLRDLCAGPHRDDPAAAMVKARDQIAMAVADLAARQTSALRVAHIMSYALVVGGGLAGLTAALSMSDAGIPVTLVERDPDLGGAAHRWPDDRETAQWVGERKALVRSRPSIKVLTSTQVTDVGGTVGHYRVTLSDNQVIEAGAVIVATGGRRDIPLLEEPVSSRAGAPKSYAFLLCDMAQGGEQTCLHSCCVAAVRQAAEIRRQVDGAHVTIFFRELYTAGGQYDELVWEAQRLGVNFVRYPAGQAPHYVDGEVVTHDELTGGDVHVPCDMIVHAAPIKPQDDAASLARLLRLPADASSFIADARVRLRPSDRIERGLYVCGAAHYPCDAQRATFEAYSAAARAVHHIRRGQIINWSPAAVIDVRRCNGCGDCVRVCPFMAVTLEPRQEEQRIKRSGESEGRLARVDTLLCTGCGNCVSVCPVKAAQVPSATDEQIEAQVHTALGGNRRAEGRSVMSSPCHLILACEWSGYSAAEIAGRQGLAYPASTRLIRLNCTGRLQPGLILKALEMGAASVMVLGCPPGVCHYEQGNERCATVFDQAHALARLLALDHRLKLEWIPPDDGVRFAQLVGDFVTGIEGQGVR